MKHILWLVFIPFLLISCDGNTDREFMVKNASSQTVQVYVESVYNSEIDTISIGIGQTANVVYHNSMGGNSNEGTMSDFIQAMTAVNDSGQVLQKDYLLNENWLIESERVSRVPPDWRHTYTFVITDADMQ